MEEEAVGKGRRGDARQAWSKRMVFRWELVAVHGSCC
jgi:hypothetical protein